MTSKISFHKDVAALAGTSLGQRIADLVSGTQMAKPSASAPSEQSVAASMPPFAARSLASRLDDLVKSDLARTNPATADQAKAPLATPSRTRPNSP